MGRGYRLNCRERELWRFMDRVRNNLLLPPPTIVTTMAVIHTGHQINTTPPPTPTPTPTRSTLSTHSKGITTRDRDRDRGGIAERGTTSDEMGGMGMGVGMGEGSIGGMRGGAMSRGGSLDRTRT